MDPVNLVGSQQHGKDPAEKISRLAGLQMAFLDGNQPDRVCAPMKGVIEKAGGEVRTKDKNA